MSHRWLIPGLLAGMMLACFAVALHMGPTRIDLALAVADSLAGRDSLEATILREIRLPRALLALLVGASLGLSGAALQGLLRNPLAEPGLIGVSGCAALGAVIALYFGFAANTWVALPAAGMAGAAVSIVLVFALAGKTSSATTLILAGIAVNALASSLISLALNFAPNPYAMSEMVYWLLGSLANRSLGDVALALPFMAGGWLLVLATRRYLDALSLGEDTAASLGFETGHQRALLVVGVAGCVGAAVSVSGNIGFVGLLVPHLVRPLVGHEPGRLLIPSLLAGAIMVLLADICVQLVSPGQELKLGVVTALVGGPFLLLLILRTRRVMP